MRVSKNLFLIVVLFTSLLISGSGIAGPRQCRNKNGLKQQFRKEQAIRIVEDLLSRITNALDNVLLTTGPNDPNFYPNIQYVLDLQVDENNMSINIDNNLITNGGQFITVWGNLAQLFDYRKRLITNNILVDYSDVKGLRKLSIHSIGTSFITIHGNNSVAFDRLVINYEEMCPGEFRVRSIVQFTESSFPLPAGGGLIPGHSPFDPPAPAAYTPPPVIPCFSSSS